MKTSKIVISSMVLLAAVVNGWGATVQIKCGDGRAVAGTEIMVFKLGILDRHEQVAFVKKEGPLDSASRGVQVAPGKYLFVVQGKNKDGDLVLLSSELTDVKVDTTILLAPLPPQVLSLSYQQSPVTITKASLRVERAPATNAIPVEPGARVILARGQTVWARVSAKNEGGAAPLYAELWQKVAGGSLALNLENEDNCFCRFNWLGDKQITVLFYPPAEPDQPESCRVPVTRDTRYVTNRKFVELSYSYPIPEGTLVVQRNNHILKGKTYTFELGGPFELSGYARFALKGAPAPHSLLWGVDLMNAQGDKVDTKASSIQWQATLGRRDGKPAPANPDHVTDAELKRVKPDFGGWGNGFQNDIWRDWDETLAAFEMDVSYQLNGQSVRQKVRPEPFVAWKSKHITMDVPRYWRAANARAYMDKLERFYQYGVYLGVQGQVPDAIHIRSTAREDAGWSSFGKETQIQLALQHMRNTFDFYTSWYAIIQIHEFMHSFGHVHGAVMDKAIRSAYFDYYCNHGKYLVEHPEYLPEPMTIVQEPTAGEAIRDGLMKVDAVYETSGGSAPDTAAKVRAELVALYDQYPFRTKPENSSGQRAKTDVERMVAHLPRPGMKPK